MKREVIYLNEADRPKAQSKLSFTDWIKETADVQTDVQGCFIIHKNNINIYYREYTSYLSELPEEKDVEFTEYIIGEGKGVETDRKPNDYNKTVYLGKCKCSGDMFAAFGDYYIYVYKGHLNSGKY